MQKEALKGRIEVGQAQFIALLQTARLRLQRWQGEQSRRGYSTLGVVANRCGHLRRLALEPTADCLLELIRQTELDTPLDHGPNAPINLVKAHSRGRRLLRGRRPNCTNH